MGLPVPQNYVVPAERFVLKPGAHQGMNVAEFEFPAYYNFFVKQRRINVICLNHDVEQRLRRVFQETLFGPEVINLSDDLEPGTVGVRDRLPNLRKELEAFRFDGKQRIEIEMLINFMVFDDGDQLVLRGEGQYEGEAVVLELDEMTEEIRVRNYTGEEDKSSEDDDLAGPSATHNFDEKDADDDGQSGVLARLPTSCTLPPPPALTSDGAPEGEFVPPLFGVTVLGCSHGFDPVGITSGYVIWINGRGLMVDPPPNSSSILLRNHIPPGLVDTVIITHCHADHDAGAFQKILQEGRVGLITTPTIYKSFLRKYAALSGLGESMLRRVFQFRPAKINEAMKFRGGELRFFYSLHSIPCMGFEVYFGDKSMRFSADTMYAPKKLEQLWTMGVLSQGRYDDLRTFPSNHDFIFHEMGGPPIHTPASALQELPDHVKERLYVVHVPKDKVPPDLKRAKEGVEHTMNLEVCQPRFSNVSFLCSARLLLHGEGNLLKLAYLPRPATCLLCKYGGGFATILSPPPPPPPPPPPRQ